MSRVVTYDRRPSIQGDGDLQSDQRNDYLDKLAKYVPAEFLVIATGFFAAFAVSGPGLWLALLLGALLNILYLWVVASRTTTEYDAPTWYFYALSALAFLAWSIATVDVVAVSVGLGGVAGASERAFVLAFAAFAIPLLDGGLTKLFPPRMSRVTR